MQTEEEHASVRRWAVAGNQTYNLLAYDDLDQGRPKFFFSRGPGRPNARGFISLCRRVNIWSTGLLLGGKPLKCQN